MRLGTELKDGGNEPVRSLSRCLASFPPAGQMTTQLTHSFMTAMAMKAAQRYYDGQTRNKKPAMHSKDASRRGKKFQQEDTENSDIKMEDGGLKFYICGNICFVK